MAPNDPQEIPETPGGDGREPEISRLSRAVGETDSLDRLTSRAEESRRMCFRPGGHGSQPLSAEVIQHRSPPVQRASGVTAAAPVSKAGTHCSVWVQIPPCPRSSDSTLSPKSIQDDNLPALGKPVNRPYAFLAQLAERRSRKAEEIGSTPMKGSSQAVARHPGELAIPC